MIHQDPGWLYYSLILKWEMEVIQTHLKWEMEVIGFWVLCNATDLKPKHFIVGFAYFRSSEGS